MAYKDRILDKIKARGKPVGHFCLTCEENPNKPLCNTCQDFMDYERAYKTMDDTAADFDRAYLDGWKWWGSTDGESFFKKFVDREYKATIHLKELVSMYPEIEKEITISFTNTHNFQKWYMTYVQKLMSKEDWMRIFKKINEDYTQTGQDFYEFYPKNKEGVRYFFDVSIIEGESITYQF